MNFDFGSDELTRLYVDVAYDMGLPAGVVKAFRRKIQFIAAAADERDLRSWKSLHMEKLKGARQDEYSIRLNDQYRLVFVIAGEGQEKRLRIIGVEDYH